jgi:multicomponent Na+:H+ antiporter subunit G
MTIVGNVLIVVGVGLAVIAGLGLVRLRTTEARQHAAGKASPIAFMVTAAGAAFHTDWAGRGALFVAVVMMTVTLPLGMHLLFRAAVRSKR